jgi:hypothetical protein
MKWGNSMAKTKSKPSAARPLSSADASILTAIELLRSDQVYRAAEALRRKNAGKTMAQAAEGTDEHRSIRILIATWMSIATLMKTVKDKSPFFRLLPICQMYQALQAEIEYLRKTLSQANFAYEVQELYDEWDAWVEEQGLSPQYVTAMCGGLTAKFG